MKLSRLKTDPKKSLELILSDKCHFPNLAVMARHLADGYDAYGEVEIARIYWHMFGKLLNNSVTYEDAIAFAQARSVGDPASEKQLTFLTEVDKASRLRYLALSKGEKKTFLEVTFEFARHGYMDPELWSEQNI